MSNYSNSPKSFESAQIPIDAISRSGLKYSFLCLIFLSIGLPTGFILAVNVKALALLMTLVAMVIYLLNERISIGLFCGMVLSVAFLAGWMLVGLVHKITAPSVILDHVRNVAAVFLIVYLSFFLAKKKVIDFYEFLRILIYGNFAFSTIKVISAFSIFGGLIGSQDFQNLYMVIFNEDWSSREISDGLLRFGFANDSVTPFLLYLLFLYRIELKISKTFAVLFAVVSTISVFLAFSRYGFAVYLLAMLLYCLTRNARIILMLPILASIFFYAYEPAQDVAKEIIELRFTSDEVATADAVRPEQIRALDAEFRENPIMGNGFGGFSPRVIRDDLRPYAYEVQWVAFAMQLGLIGLGILVGYVLTIAIVIARNGTSKITISMLILYLAWLGSGFTNPYLVSSIGGCIFSLFLLWGVRDSFKPDAQDYVSGK